MWEGDEGPVITALLDEASSHGNFPGAFYRELKHDFMKGGRLVANLFDFLDFYKVGK